MEQNPGTIKDQPPPQEEPADLTLDELASPAYVIEDHNDLPKVHVGGQTPNESGMALPGVTPAVEKAERVFNLGQFFKNHPLFAAASEGFTNELCSKMRIRHQQPGDVIIQEGEIGRAMFFVVKGSVTVISADGERFFAELSAGNFFGGKSLSQNPLLTV
jgi:hypothetical protein